MQDHYDQWRNAENQVVEWSVECRDIKHSAVNAQNCRDQGVDFQPLVVETLGGWDPDALKFLKEIARIDARRWGKDEAIEIKQFFQRLSISLQRGNAALLIERDVEPTNSRN